MKTRKIYLSLFLAAGTLGYLMPGFAATCNATQGTITTTATISGNTCGHNSNFNGSTFCGGVAFSNGGTDAYQVTLGAGQNFSFSVTSPGTAGGASFVPDIALVSATCADNAACVGENTTGTATVTNPGSGTFSGHPAGTYFIYITDSNGTGACGNYDLSFSGTLPVKLQKFTVN